MIICLSLLRNATQHPLFFGKLPLCPIRHVTIHSGAFFCIDSVVELKQVACTTLSTPGIITITDLLCIKKLKNQTLPCCSILNVQW